MLIERANRLLLVVMCAQSCFAQGEYTYPVASFTDIFGTRHTYFLHQKSATHTELLSCSGELVVPTMYNPSAISLLPEGLGFSFLENDRIRVVYHDMDTRLPKTISCDERLYNLGLIQWINGHTCYLHAKRNKQFGIFQVTVNGEVSCLATSDTHDCMYPSTIEDTLFYIIRTPSDGESQPQYAIAQRPYLPELCHAPELADFEEWVKAMLTNDTHEAEGYALPADKSVEQIVIDFGSRPIMFLSMICANQGFFIEHPVTMDSTSEVLPLVCHYMHKTDRGWVVEPLVTFSVPMNLVLPSSPTCFYESILPLLPRYKNGRIYYVEGTLYRGLQGYCVDLTTKVSCLADGEFKFT